MSKIDVCTKAYMSNPRFFSDAFNYYFFQGKLVVRPEELTVQDITELAIPYGEENMIVPAQKYRDLLKMWTIMTSDKATYMLLGVENQANVHYAMPIRNMLYDALNYSSQVEKIGRGHRKRKDAKCDEFLSGFKKADKIKPIFTLVIYWGTKNWDAPKSLYEMFDIQDGMTEVVKKYVNDYKLHVIVPNEIENFEQFSTELGYCLRYIRSSTNQLELKQLLKDYYDVYSSFDKESGNLLQVVTKTKLPKESEKEDYVDMCKAIEDMIKDAKQEGKEEMRKSARCFFETGGTLEIAVKVFSSLSKEELISIKSDI